MTFNKITITAKELTPGDKIKVSTTKGPVKYVAIGRVVVNMCDGMVQVTAKINGRLSGRSVIGQDTEVEVLR
jgi:3-dehydroquinate synthase class II